MYKLNNKKTKVLIYITSILCILASVVYINRDTVMNLYEFGIAVFSSYGSTGWEVTNIQSKLAQYGYSVGPIDGIYGYKTYRAVKLFQTNNGLVVDGICGPATLAAIGLPTGSTIYTNSNANLLAHAIYAEARGEPYVGQVAVGAVIINRTNNVNFPATIAGVIYQPGAFTAVDDGQINLDPDKSAYNAANDALNGWDPTDGCIYYYNPATATNQWIRSRPIVITIGKHVFTR